MQSPTAWNGLGRVQTGLAAPFRAFPLCPEGPREVLELVEREVTGQSPASRSPGERHLKISHQETGGAFIFSRLQTPADSLCPPTCAPKAQNGCYCGLRSPNRSKSVGLKCAWRDVDAGLRTGGHALVLEVLRGPAEGGHTQGASP